MTDVLNTIKDLLSNNWNIDNTDDIKPNVDVIFNYKRISLRNNEDWILLYQAIGYSQDANGIGSTTKQIKDSITLDLRSMYSRAHTIKVKEEIIRILDTNITNPATNYDVLKVTDVKDLSDKTIKLWRFIIEIEMEGYNVTRG